MQFPFSLFGDLLAEFQKYLTDRISRPAYWAMGLVVVMLGIIVSYLSGWNVLLDAWNRADTFFKLVLSGAAIVIFLLLVYLLGQMQGTVERWFQGDWPHRWRTGSLEWHRAAWQARRTTFQDMGDLYGSLYAARNVMKQEKPQQKDRQPILWTTRALPRYAIITDTDLEAVDINNIPHGALHDLHATVGMMIQHPIDAGAIVTDADVVRLPAELEHAVITAISVSALIVPAGLIPGDLIVIYTQAHKKDRAVPFNPALVLEAQQMSGEESNGTRIDLVHLTLAVPPNDLETFVTLADTQVVRVVRLAPQLTPPPTPQATGSQPATAVPPPSSPDSIDNQIKQLDKEYKAGEQWFKRLRAGTVKKELPPHKDELTKAFALIENLPAATSMEQRENWLRQVNVNWNGWIRLLDDAYKEIEYRIDQHKKIFSLYYPSTIERIAPTAIGNVVHAVDSYCDDLYGLDIALVLPRLQAVMEERTRDQLTKAHDQLELFEWLYLGSIVTGIIGTVLAFHAQHYLLALLLWFLVLPVPRFILYPVALRAALDYAAALRLAIDRERGKIISMAGFSLPSPTNQEQEKALWNQIQQWWAYGTPPGDYTLTTEGASSDTSSEKTT
jgi:hypothetical protein